MHKQNKEQLEARQRDIDEDRIYRMQFLTKKDRDQVAFVEKELVKFQKKGIPMYLYAYLPAIDDDGHRFEAIYQYNTLNCFYEEDGKGNPKPECNLRNYHVHKHMIYHMIRQFGNIAEIPEKFEELHDMVTETLSRLYNAFMLNLTKDDLEESLKKEIDENNKR